MHRIVLMESNTEGLLYVNGQFCGPLGREGQAFPAGKDAQIYIQLFPFGADRMPLAAQLCLRAGRLETLLPEKNCYALLWPDGVIQLELMVGESAGQAAKREEAVSGTLLRYLSMRLAGDAQAALLWMNGQEGAVAADLSGYQAVVPLRYAPEGASGRFDERAGLVRRIAENAARVDAALAVTVPAGQGRRLIERMEILRGEG